LGRGILYCPGYASWVRVRAWPVPPTGTSTDLWMEQSMALNKDQLITDIAEATDLSKTSVRAVLDQLAQIAADELEHSGEITLPGLGKLKVGERPARTGRNPQTGA